MLTADKPGSSSEVKALDHEAEGCELRLYQNQAAMLGNLTVAVCHRTLYLLDCMLLELKDTP